jgi:hypothetical protein
MSTDCIERDQLHRTYNIIFLTLFTATSSTSYAKDCVLLSMKPQMQMPPPISGSYRLAEPSLAEQNQTEHS